MSAEKKEIAREKAKTYAEAFNRAVGVDRQLDVFVIARGDATALICEIRKGLKSDCDMIGVAVVATAIEKKLVDPEKLNIVTFIRHQAKTTKSIISTANQTLAERFAEIIGDPLKTRSMVREILESSKSDKNTRVFLAGVGDKGETTITSGAAERSKWGALAQYFIS